MKSFIPFKKALMMTIFAMLSLMLSAESNLKTLADEFSSYKNITTRGNLDDLVMLLKDETIRFSDFSSLSGLTMFKYEVPDTIWLKGKPKKNAKEGKHYRLRKMYRGQINEGGSYAYEYTAPIEMVGAIFNVLWIEQVPNKYNTLHKSYKIHLKNIVTDEVLYWELSNAFVGSKFKVHLMNLIARMDLNGRTLYSTDGYKNYTQVTKHHCTNFDAYIDVNGLSTALKIIFTTIDENNNIADNVLKLDYSKYSDVLWFDENQISKVLDANKTYEIDYLIRMRTATSELPFNFSSIIGVVNSYKAMVGQKIIPSKYGDYDSLAPSEFIYSEDAFLIGDRINVRGTSYLKGVLDGKAFYIPESDVKLFPEEKMKLDSLVNCSEDIRNLFFESAKALSYYHYYKNLGEAVEAVAGFSEKGISIRSLVVYDMSEYTDGTGIRFSFHNPTNKTIKYVNVGFCGYNAVDDRVGSAIAKKCVGPIAPDETATYEFDYAWFTDVVDYAKVTSLSVQYTDGSVKVVHRPTSVIWTDKIKNAFKTRLEGLRSKLEKTEE